MGVLDLDRVAASLGEIATLAGRFLAGVTDRTAGRARKADGSEATAADLESERLILARLAAAYPDIPAVAEETVRTTGERFFLIDPLDGTRDYLTGSGEYSVNIALVAGDRPVAAALAAPATDRVWYAGGTGAFVAPMLADGRMGAPRPVAARPAPAEGLVALASRQHGDPETERSLAAYTLAKREPSSSAVKFGLLASGEADLYIRCGPTMEWDTAAGDHILVRAGGLVVGPDGGPLRYGRAGEGFLNGPFAAMGDPRLRDRLALPQVCPEPQPR